MKSILWLRLTNFRTHYKMFLLMLGLAVLFTFAFSSGSGEVTVVIPVVDHDRSELSEALIARIDQNRLYQVRLIEQEQMERGVSDGRYELGVVIPEKMEQVVMISSRDSVFIMSFQGFLEGQLRTSSQQQVLITATHAILPDFPREQIAEITAKAWEKPDAVKIAVSHLQAENAVKYDQNVQALFGFTLFFSMYLTLFFLGEILEDRRKGIWNRLIVSPLSKAQLYGGNFIYSYALSMIQVTAMILFGHFVIGINWGNSLGLVFLILLCFVFCVMALGMLLVGIAKTPQQMQSLIPLVSVTAAMLGGSYWPLEIISSQILLLLATLSPIYYGLEAIKQVVLYGQSFSAIAGYCAVLAGAGIIFCAAGIMAIEKKD